PEEYSRRRMPEELLCLAPEAIQAFRPRPLHELAAAVGAERAAAARQRWAGLGPEERRREVRRGWAGLLGAVEAGADPKVLRKDRQALASAAVERVALEVEPGVTVPLLLFLPSSRPGARLPVVVGLAQEGKRGFLARRPGTIAELLGGGAAVCLVDVRG